MSGEENNHSPGEEPGGLKGREKDAINREEEDRLTEMYRNERERDEYIGEKQNWLDRKYRTLITNGGYLSKDTRKATIEIRDLIREMSDYSDEFTDQINKSFDALRRLRSLR